MPVTITHNSHTHNRLTQDIVGKLWNLCNVLKDDGVTYHQYVTELTHRLFLKMVKQTCQEQGIPEGMALGCLGESGWPQADEALPAAKNRSRSQKW